MGNGQFNLVSRSSGNLYLHKHLHGTLIWISDMLVRRKDHACALVQIDNERGILVSGGVDNEDNLLDSVEFYNLATQAWEEISALKNARTEHGM